MQKSNIKNIKVESIIWDGGSDFWYVAMDDIDADSSSQRWALLDAAEKDGSDLKMDFVTESRDGLFEDDQLFAVFSEADTRGLIRRLKQALEAP